MLSLELLRTLNLEESTIAWSAIFEHAWSICSESLPSKNAASEIVNRDRKLASLDLYLSSVGWHLWLDYYSSTTRTSQYLIQWWQEQKMGCAVLILDGLSLREAPWIIEQAKERGYKVDARVTASELPGDTRTFARALGLQQRSSLENNHAPATFKLAGAHTDTSSNNWTDCASLIGAQPQWFFWHHWPDNRIHDLGGQSGHGLQDLSKEIEERLSDSSFWTLIERLMYGRKLLITSDHGYAASGLFHDITDLAQVAHLKSVFSSGRYTTSASADTNEIWIPPIDMNIDNSKPDTRMVLGRRRWKSPGGYPTLTHGGLSILECASPLIELSR